MNDDVLDHVRGDVLDPDVDHVHGHASVREANLNVDHVLDPNVPPRASDRVHDQNDHEAVADHVHIQKSHDLENVAVVHALVVTNIAFRVIVARAVHVHAANVHVLVIVSDHIAKKINPVEHDREVNDAHHHVPDRVVPRMLNQAQALQNDGRVPLNLGN